MEAAAGRRRRSGSAARRGSSAAPRSRARSSSAAARACTGAQGRRRRRGRRPPRRSSPAYMTATRSQASATIPRLWVMRRSAVPKLSRQVGEDPEDLRLDDHVERGRRLVGDEELRPQHERERDHDPLPHPAGELVRVLAEARRRDSHSPERLERRGCGSRGRSDPGSCCSSVSLKWSSIRISGFSRVIGSWKIRPRSGPRRRRSSLSRHPDEVPSAVEDLRRR